MAVLGTAPQDRSRKEQAVAAGAQNKRGTGHDLSMKLKSGLLMAICAGVLAARAEAAVVRLCNSCTRAGREDLRRPAHELLRAMVRGMEEQDA